MAENRYELNKNLAQMLKGGVIMSLPVLNFLKMPAKNFRF